MMKSSNTPNATHIALNERPRDPSKSIKSQREEKKKGRNTKTNNNKRHTPKALDASAAAAAALKAIQYQCLSAYLLPLHMAVESVIGFNALRVQ